ncbi:MAG: cytochrome c oxidase subunit 3 [Bacteroidia bacterium]|nr:cytochrome c oxidase subunit 3 [Bacteroidia bacterium]
MMEMSAYGIELEKRNYIFHPQKFALWLFILTVIMIFGGLTSAYIVQQSFVSEEKRIFFDLPEILWVNLGIILFSSVTMQYAMWVARQNERTKALVALGMTLILGIMFLIGQVNAWGAMTASGMPMVDSSRFDNSVSFFYVFTGLHGAHIVGGLIVLSIVFIRTALQNYRRPGQRALTYELTGIFWHFLGLLWVYLFIFLKITQN